MTLRERDLNVIWHPYTQMQGADVLPIVRAEGAMLWTENGLPIIDAISSWWVVNHGHAHPHIVQAIQRQVKDLSQVIFAGCTHPVAVSLAERLLKRLERGFVRVFFSDDGSTAVEVALKMAFQFHYNRGAPRAKVIALRDAYHGDTFGAMAVSGRSVFTRAFEPLLFEVAYLDTPTEANGANVLSQLKIFLEQGDVAACILEPLVLGAGGMLMYPAELLADMLRLCRTYEVPTIVDEVLTGFGRTGRMFALDYIDVAPDIVCFSKGLTGGFLPMGITVCAAHIYEAFLSKDRSKALFHGHSFTANALACAAACASLELFEQPATWADMNRLCANLEAFRMELETTSGVRRARRLGGILAFDLETDIGAGYLNEISVQVHRFALERGVLLRPLGQTVYVMPPFCISEAQLQQVFDVIREWFRR